MQDRPIPLIMFATILFIMGCSEPSYTPKPKGYPRIVFPERSYQVYNNEVCPIYFEYPTYAEVLQDTIYFNEEPEYPCWLNVNFTPFNATLHLSYKDLKDYKLEELLEDMHKLTYKHSSKADYIEDQKIETENNVSGLMFDVGGNAASSTQFYLTDNENHFIRGALYINTTPNLDSLSPIIDFLQQDVNYIINSMKWR